MRLTKAQKELVLKWIAAGLHSDEINQLAAQQTVPFQVGRSQVRFYRRTRQKRLEQIRQAGEDQAMVDGYASTDYRVRKLAMLAQLIEDDLLTHSKLTGIGELEEDEEAELRLPAGNKLWLRQVKGIGSRENFEKVVYYEFNGAELAQYRGLLDDIAKETGGRVTKQEIEQELTVIWDLPVPGWTPPSEPSSSA